MRKILNGKEIGDKLADTASKKKIEAAIKHVIRW